MKKENQQEPSRRQFLSTLGKTGALAVPMMVPGAVLGKDGQLPPSERITIAVLGVGNRGRGSIGAMRPLPDHQVVAIAEAREDRGLSACRDVESFYSNRLGKESYKGCKLYRDFRDILLRDDIDAVWGTICDHWHGPLYSRIIESGKDIYGEKPLTRWVGQGIKVKKLVRQYGTIFQVGTQQRSEPHFRLACMLARNGYLGKISEVQVAAPGGTKIPAVPSCDPPKGFDWDMWSGPAPLLPFDPRRVEWLGLYMIEHYCAGFITNWGVHHLDIAGWGVPEVFEKPFWLDGSGVLPDSGMADTWISWQMTMNYDSGLVMKFVNSGNPYKQGCKFIGDEGWVHVNRSGITASNPKLLGLAAPTESDGTAFLKTNDPRLFAVKLTDAKEQLHVSPYYPGAYTAHTADFFQSMRTRKDPVSPVEQGHYATTLGNISDICLRLGRKLRWNPAKDEFVNDDEANLMRFRAERSPWTM
ncbi:MAG: Gfo/Idh/MocA family oxidoreductase [Planctomycetia bacterium]|nr:Gfo/Idh/MocA family oxidoreductase [Planctomycetia bacterium]